MAKIIKVGSQNPTFTPAKTRKANSIQTHRNSNEVTNPFKFTNFEGNTWQVADVFEGFKPRSTSKLRMIATSATGSMNKMKSSIAEPIVNFVRRVRENVSSAWAYAKNTNISDVPVFKRANEILNTPIHVPAIDKFVDVMNKPIHIEGLDIMASKMSEIKEGMTARVVSVMDASKELATKWNGVVANISFQGKQKYANMTVAELETHFAAALAEGGINE